MKQLCNFNGAEKVLNTEMEFVKRTLCVILRTRYIIYMRRPSKLDPIVKVMLVTFTDIRANAFQVIMFEERNVNKR